MQWGSATEFFAMGGYGLYVWAPPSAPRPSAWCGKYSQYGVDIPRRRREAVTCSARRILIR